MNAELLSILVCPQTKNKLIEAPDEVLQKINKLIQEEKCTNIGKEKVSEKFSQGLWEAQNKVFYPLIDEIPVLVYEKGIIIQ